jgi:hypothetical protein
VYQSLSVFELLLVVRENNTKIKQLLKQSCKSLQGYVENIFVPLAMSHFKNISMCTVIDDRDVSL